MTKSLQTLKPVLLQAARATALMSLIQVALQFLKAWGKNRPFSDTHFESWALIGLPVYFVGFAVYLWWQRKRNELR